MAVAGFLLLCSGFSQAHVLIYKASFKSSFDADSAGDFPRKGGAYFIINPEANGIAVIVFDPVKKRIIDTVPPQDSVRFATPNLPKGHTATVVTLGFLDSNGAQDYAHSFFYFRGVNKTLTTQIQPVKHVNTAPRTLTGQILEASKHAEGSAFLELRFVLAFQGERTVAVNEEPTTVQQVYDDLLSELRQKGFTEEL